MRLVRTTFPDGQRFGTRISKRPGKQASERGELLLGGAFANPVDGAVLLFQGDSAEVAEKFAKADPYVTNGAVKRWYVREWTTVAGKGAATPVRPNVSPAAETV
jgi:hypothetical protein